MKNDYIRIVVDGYVLVARCKGSTNTFLPGGHVEFGESLPAALARELFEEVEFCVQVSNYIGMVEHQWIESDRHRHQINHVFAALLPNVEAIPTLESREEHLEFFWVRPSELSQHNLMPSPLIELVEHFVKGVLLRSYRKGRTTCEIPLLQLSMLSSPNPVGVRVLFKS